MTLLSGTYQVSHPDLLALKQISISSKYVYNPSSRSPISSSIVRRRIMLAPETHSTLVACRGVGGTAPHGDSSFETIPKRSPRSSSFAIPKKRNGEALISPFG